MTDETTAAAIDAHPVELETAIAISDANLASGFDAPPQIQAVIDLATPAEIRGARTAIKARIAKAAADAAAEEKAAAAADKAQPTAPPPASAGAAEPKE